MFLKSNVLIICMFTLCIQFYVRLSANKIYGRLSKGYKDGGHVESTTLGTDEINFNIGPSGLSNDGNISQSIGQIVGTGSSSITIRNKGLSGLAKLLDDRFLTIDRMASPNGGIPEDTLGQITFCAEFIYNGMFALIFIIIRYPLKIMSKAILFTGAFGFILTYSRWCIDPIKSNIEFTSNGKKINQHMDKIVGFKEQFKKRIIWITDKANHSDRQMYFCCAFHEYKRKLYREVPEAIKFMKLYHNGLYKLPELIWCWKYQMGSEFCDKVDLKPTNEEPDRIVPLSFYTLSFELLDKYI